MLCEKKSTQTPKQKHELVCVDILFLCGRQSIEKRPILKTYVYSANQIGIRKITSIIIANWFENNMQRSCDNFFHPYRTIFFSQNKKTQFQGREDLFLHLRER